MDLSWGELNSWGYVRSMFFPGKGGQSLFPGIGKPQFEAGFAGFQSAQTSINDLPQPARQLVSELANTDVQKLSKTYGISEPAAARLRQNASWVHTYGLREAITRYDAWRWK
jgi:hypothetical protein